MDLVLLTLVAGYILAVPALVVIIWQLWKTGARLPNTFALVAEYVGAGLLVAGWFSLGNYPATFVNALWIVSLTGICVRCIIKSKKVKS